MKLGNKMTKTTHIHKLKRLKYKSGNTVFFCALPDCNFKTNISLVLGKRSLCWRCGEPFIMNEYSLRLSKPHCDNCHKTKKEVPWIHEPSEVEKEATKELVESISLAERLNKTIQQAQKTTTEENEDEL